MNILKVLNLCVLCCALIPVGVNLFLGADIQALSVETNGQPELLRSGDTDGADAPSGRLFLRVPAAVPSESAPPQPPVESAEPPAEPFEPEAESEPSPPSFFDEPIAGSSVFVIDVSLSMNDADVGAVEDYDGNAVASASRLMAVKTELINFLRATEDGFRFDIVWLAGGDHPLWGPCLPVTDAWKGELVECTAETREAAIEAVKSQQMWWGTPNGRPSDAPASTIPTSLDRSCCLPMERQFREKRANGATARIKTRSCGIFRCGSLENEPMDAR